ncbi:MAG: DUF4465 domain-containing protein [Planctomycetaceae bacterium]
MTFNIARVICASALGMAFVAFQPAAQAGPIVDFEDLSLAPESYWNGPDPAGTDVAGPFGPVREGSFSSGGVDFVNRYDLTFGNWSGFAYSNTTDNVDGTFGNQHSAYTGSGRGAGDDNYGVAFGYKDLEPNLIDPDPFDPTNVDQLTKLPFFTLPENYQIDGIYVTNTTYAALTMANGNDFSKKFGGVSGTDSDFLKLSAYGTDQFGDPLGEVVEFYLADVGIEHAGIHIVDTWEFMDLSPLSQARRIYFNLSSSDVGIFGINTPTYFAVDDISLNEIQAVPEPGGLALLVTGSCLAGWAAVRRRRHGESV